MLIFQGVYLKTTTTEVFLRESKNHGRISPNTNHVTGTGSEMPGIQHWKRRNKIMSEFDHQRLIYPSKIEWDLTNGPRSVSCNREFFDTQVFSGSVKRGSCVLGQISWNLCI